MNRISKIVKKIKLFIAFLVGLIISGGVHKYISDILLPICGTVVLGALFVLAGVEVFKHGVEAWQGGLAKREQCLWNNIKGNARINIANIISQNVELPFPVIYQLLAIYRHDESICGALLNNLVRMYDENDRYKDIISHILLHNCHNLVIASKFDERPELKLQCEKLMKDNVNYLHNFDINANVLSTKFIIGLFDICLLDSNFRKDEMVSLFRSLSIWMLRKQSGLITDEEKRDMVVVASLLPWIEKKLHNTGIQDEWIADNLDKIRCSKWFKNTLFEVYKDIIVKLSNNLIVINGNNNMEDLSMLYTYYEKLPLRCREKLYHVISRRNKELKTSLDSDYEILSLVLFVSPMQKSNPEEDIVYKLATMVCLCAGQFLGK